MNYPLLSSCLLLIIALSNWVSANNDVILNPKGETHPVEGNDFEATCTVTGKTELQNATFVVRGNKKVEDSVDGRQKLSRTVDGLKEVIKVSWKPLKFEDRNTLKDLTCLVGADKIGYSYNIDIIPKENVPTINLEPNSTTIYKGKNIEFSCSAKMVWFDEWEEFKLEWLKDEKLIDAKKDKDKYEIVKGIDEKTNKTRTLRIMNAELEDAGVYRCQANIEYKTGRRTGSDFSKTSKLAVKWNGAQPANEEIVVKNEESVTMDCVIEGYPVPTLEWKKDGEVITALSDSRYSFTNSSKQVGADNSRFTISTVTYSDRGEYQCVGTFKPEGAPIITRTKKFILRVRDPLGALWPTIGIVVEAFLLFLIIALYSCFKKSKHQNSDKVDGKDGDAETSPLVKDGPKVSYSSGDDGVRARMNAGEKA